MTIDDPANNRTDPGFGLGLRRELVRPVIAQHPAVDWFEILSDSYLDADEETMDQLLQIGAEYPLLMHGAGLSIGGPDPLDEAYISQLKTLMQRVEPIAISDHLCWTLPGQSHSYDLRPLPRTIEMIDHLSPRIREVQERLGRRLMLENISAYHQESGDQMPEWDFMTAVAEASDSLILLDLNNVLSNCNRLGLEPMAFVRNLPAQRIRQIHLAPPASDVERQGDPAEAVKSDPIWQLYRDTLKYTGRVATMIERNDDIPPLEEMVKELEQARTIARRS
ncbi:MAG: DUF692 domain-containing protein [gamma proteobacterium endosymbiont of Lamellibrachia anaximandri]|nr:DUF692 domain-containing protein [gamma proteobacterium endosymbiont of Lamellibrachia anaximandri]MBL3533323.1 DUF692 domain-containing protein [gamma proteobacterium endosymbiont of Lamellibrachia anaximandri]